jgi:rifampicin phosphotransferase
MTTEAIISPGSPEASDATYVGGKGANLGLLTAAGFPVPAWFCVSTSAHRQCLRESGLEQQITAIAAEIDFVDLEATEVQTARIRELIESTPFPPATEQAVRAAYAMLGEDAFVAVRSSALAEDLAGASFAGMQDTYLDVRGEEIFAAIRRCWASVWSARAATYRHNKGFSQSDVVMSVVVQKMVVSDTSGVMFTGNPLTTATDEIVINASYGLGEGIVAGIASPDQYVVKTDTLRVREKQIGAKAKQVVRNPDAASGTIEVEVDQGARAAQALTDQEIRELAALGRRVQSYYEEIPQDIEWAIEHGSLYLLQARPITGVEFAWDSDVDTWQDVTEEDDAVWSRALADEAWTGAISPLFYSWRAPQWWWLFCDIAGFVGREDLFKVRSIKWYRGQAYWNTKWDMALIEKAPPATRLGMVLAVPEDMREQALAQPFSAIKYMVSYVRTMSALPRLGPYNWFKVMQNHFDNRIEDATGLTDEEVRLLSDAGLRRYIEDLQAYEHEYNIDITWPGFFLYGRDSISLVYYIMTNWYAGENPSLLGDLMAGFPEMSASMVIDVELSKIAGMIRDSQPVMAAFEGSNGEEFMTALDRLEGGAQVRAAIDRFLVSYGHRGHSDRDIYFERYVDNPQIVYNAIEAHMRSDIDIEEQHRANNRRRDELVDEVVENLKRQPLGFLKAEAFKLALPYALRFLALRDNERQHIDRHAYAFRKAALEAQRRLEERGLADSDRDVWFLTLDELFEHLARRSNRTLTRAKIAARMSNFDAIDHKEWTPPKFIKGHVPMPERSSVTMLDDGSSVLSGVPASRGVVTGTARLVKKQSEIGKVGKGEIAVVNSTDPGWTPMFAGISGIVAETGGLLSHFACLAREYGLPAAQIENALKLIPDGAEVTVDGNTGQVIVRAGGHASAGPDAGEGPPDREAVGAGA